MVEIAEQAILAPSGLDEGRLTKVLDTVMSRGVDYADLYFELSREEAWSLEDGIVKEGSHSIEQGVGVRAISGERTGFAYTDEVLLPALIEASDAARAIARSGGHSAVQAWGRPAMHRLYLPIEASWANAWPHGACTTWPPAPFKTRSRRNLFSTTRRRK